MHSIARKIIANPQDKVGRTITLRTRVSSPTTAPTTGGTETFETAPLGIIGSRPLDLPMCTIEYDRYLPVPPVITRGSGHPFMQGNFIELPWESNVTIRPKGIFRSIRFAYQTISDDPSPWSLVYYYLKDGTEPYSFLDTEGMYESGDLGPIDYFVMETAEATLKVDSIEFNA